MGSLQAVQILSISVILMCITSSVYACPCAQKHPQYHYCVSEYVFRATVLEIKGVTKASLKQPIEQKEEMYIPNVKPTTSMLTTQDILTTELDQSNSTVTTENASLTVETKARKAENWTTEQEDGPKIRFEEKPTLMLTTKYILPTELEQSNSTSITKNAETERRDTEHQGVPILQYETESTSYQEYSVENDYPSYGLPYEYPRDYYIRYRVNVDKIFKGHTTNTKVDIYTLADLNDCGLRHLQNSSTYLFSVSKSDDGRMYVTNCDWVQNYDDMTRAQLAGLLKTYGRYCKPCHNTEDCSNHPRYEECNSKYSSCIRRPLNQGKLGCQWERSAEHRDCRQAAKKSLETGTIKNIYLR